SLNAYADELTMSWDHIRELSKDDLVTIGSHAITHTNLSSLSSEEMYMEIHESRKRIENETGKGVVHFSYPFGNYEAVQAREFSTLQTSSYLTAATTRNAHIFPQHAQFLWCLPRIGIDGNNETIKHFKVLMSGALSAFQYPLKQVITTE
ncbi:MAG: polysaccharide deacetylase family protein, partial [bacterium]